MFTPRVRFAIMVVAILFGCFELNQGDRDAYLPFLGAALLLFGHFRYGPIRPAFRAMQRQQFEDARKLVDSIRYPNLLSSQSKTYYHWIRGALATVEPVDLSVAERELQLAADGHLRSSSDRCLVLAALAEIAAHSNNLARANSLLAAAMELKPSAAAAQYLDDARARIREIVQQ